MHLLQPAPGGKTWGPLLKFFQLPTSAMFLPGPTSLSQKDMTTWEPRIMRQAVNSRQAMSEDDILHLSLSLRVKEEQEKPSLAWDNFRM